MSATMVEPDIAGGESLAIQTWGYLNGSKIDTVGAAILPHEHEENAMAEGSLWFTINGMGVCRMGDLALCEDPAIASQVWFDIS